MNPVGLVRPLGNWGNETYCPPRRRQTSLSSFVRFRRVLLHSRRPAFANHLQLSYLLDPSFSGGTIGQDSGQRKRLLFRAVNTAIDFCFTTKPPTTNPNYTPTSHITAQSRYLPPARRQRASTNFPRYENDRFKAHTIRAWNKHKQAPAWWICLHPTRFLTAMGAMRLPAMARCLKR